MPGMDELSTLVNRLEAVALRLEGAAGTDNILTANKYIFVVMKIIAIIFFLFVHRFVNI